MKALSKTDSSRQNFVPLILGVVLGNAVGLGVVELLFFPHNAPVTGLFYVPIAIILFFPLAWKELIIWLGISTVTTCIWLSLKKKKSLREIKYNAPLIFILAFVILCVTLIGLVVAFVLFWAFIYFLRQQSL